MCKYNKKALIVGISDYGDRAPRLDSPMHEIQGWRDLLMEDYGFGCGGIRMLANERARRDEILYRLEWLFKDAQPEDQLVFLFAGHGVKIQPRNRDTGEILDGMDEALLAYPSAPTDDLEKMAIFDDELFELYASLGGASGANVTFILDCCHGGGFNGVDMPRQPRVMSVSPPIDLCHRALARTNGCGAAGHANGHGTRSLAARARSRGVPMPVLVNAAGELNLSVELEIEGKQRSLFSYHALKALRANPNLTYNELIDHIRDTIDDYYPQHANLRGSEARRDNRFLN